jgi:uncharacterized protein YjbJ (UPF0337 family)
MNTDQFQGKWEQVKGQVKEKWGKFTNDDVTAINGKKDKLIGKLRERYGYTAEQAEEELGMFMKNCNCDSDSKVNVKNPDQIAKTESQPSR